MTGWRHSGFNVYCGPRIHPGEEGTAAAFVTFAVAVVVAMLTVGFVAALLAIGNDVVRPG
jgi:hypothetical protein